MPSLPFKNTTPSEQNLNWDWPNLCGNKDKQERVISIFDAMR
jgi:hypothetical protein